VSVLERLRGGLIVSVQAESNSPLNAPAAIAMLARVAESNGAAAVRVEGGARIGAVRRAVAIPVIGLVKRAYAGFAPYITATEREIAEVAAAGAEIVAFDATGRGRPDGRDGGAVIASVHRRGLVALADCATAADAQRAADAGAEIVATTLCGYTDATRGERLPALDVVVACARTTALAVCEGGVRRVDDVRAAFAAGADAVVVGTALTNVDVLVRGFVAAAAAYRRANDA